jgi:ParB family transcriptional regulator, chromosome partitioning protein
MNAATEVGTAEVRNSPLVQEIPLTNISESKTNPRSRYDERKLAELAANIQQHGVLQAIVVRPHANGAPDTFELVAGSRRYRASKLARRETIPGTVRELTDAESREIQLIENLQREDVHELDEACGYAALLELEPNSCTVETIALKVGCSPAYVNGRLQLLNLIEEAKQAFRAAKLTVSPAFEIARLQEKDQHRALRECFPEHRSPSAVLKDGKAKSVTVRELRVWIEREVHLDLANAPFDPQDADLLPSAGSCAKCPKRTGNNPLLFPEANLKKSTCIDRGCFHAKVVALVQIRVKLVEAEGEKAIRVSHLPAWQTNRLANVLYEGQFRRAEQRGECPTTKPAVFIDGKNAGTVFHLCQNEKCAVHAAVTRYQPTPQECQKRAKEALADRVEKETRLRVLDAIREKLPVTISRPDTAMATLDYFHRLGHDNQRRLCRVYGWEEKKTKSAHGMETVNYANIAALRVHGMSHDDLHRFLVVCSLVGDLYTPAYSGTHTLSKASNLARTAARHKIDMTRIAATVRGELTKRKGAQTQLKKGKSSISSLSGKREPPKTKPKKPN